MKTKPALFSRPYLTKADADVQPQCVETLSTGSICSSRGVGHNVIVNLLIRLKRMLIRNLC